MKDIEILIGKLKGHIPSGWAAYQSCFFNPVSVTCSEDFVSVSPVHGPSEWVGAHPKEQRLKLRAQWYEEKSNEAQTIAIQLRSKGFKVSQDGPSVSVKL